MNGFLGISLEMQIGDLFLGIFKTSRMPAVDPKVMYNFRPPIHIIHTAVWELFEVSYWLAGVNRFRPYSLANRCARSLASHPVSGCLCLRFLTVTVFHSVIFRL